MSFRNTSSLTSELAHGQNSDRIPSGFQDFCSPEEDQTDGNDITDLEQYYARTENGVQSYARAEVFDRKQDARQTDLQISPNTVIHTATKTTLQAGACHVSVRIQYANVVLTANLGCTRARWGDIGPYSPSRAVLITIRLATVIKPCVAKSMAEVNAARTLETHRQG